MHKAAKGVRYAICKEDLVIFILELVFKLQAIIAILGQLLLEVVVSQLLLGEPDVGTALRPLPSCLSVGLSRE